MVSELDLVNVLGKCCLATHCKAYKNYRYQQLPWQLYTTPVVEKGTAVKTKALNTKCVYIVINTSKLEYI